MAPKKATTAKPMKASNAKAATAKPMKAPQAKAKAAPIAVTQAKAKSAIAAPMTMDVRPKAKATTPMKATTDAASAPMLFIVHMEPDATAKASTTLTAWQRHQRDTSEPWDFSWDNCNVCRATPLHVCDDCGFPHCGMHMHDHDCQQALLSP